MLVDDAAKFQRAMRHCTNLVAIHRTHGGANPGRRDEEVSLNRAVVVMSVAAWQAAIQDVMETMIVAGQPAAGDPTLPAYTWLAGAIRGQIERFSTPNTEKTKELMRLMNFDPTPHWTWTQMGGQGVGKITVTPQQACTKLNEWLRLRHDIAHGHANLTPVSVLKAVRDNPAPIAAWHPNIRLVDAEQCMSFFRRLSSLTATAIGVQIGQPSGSWLA